MAAGRTPARKCDRQWEEEAVREARLRTRYCICWLAWSLMALSASSTLPPWVMVGN
jgi:hypothetical protein